MTNKYGPTRGEHRFRLIASLAILAVLVGLTVMRGAPASPGAVEAYAIAGGFALLSAGWSGWKLWTGDAGE